MRTVESIINTKVTAKTPEYIKVLRQSNYRHTIILCLKSLQKVFLFLNHRDFLMLLREKENHQCDPKALPGLPLYSSLSRLNSLSLSWQLHWIILDIRSCQVTSSCKACAYAVIPVPYWSTRPTQSH